MLATPKISKFTKLYPLYINVMEQATVYSFEYLRIVCISGTYPWILCHFFERDRYKSWINQQVLILTPQVHSWVCKRDIMIIEVLSVGQNQAFAQDLSCLSWWQVRLRKIIQISYVFQQNWHVFFKSAILSQGMTGENPNLCNSLDKNTIMILPSMTRKMQRKTLQRER